MLRNLFIVAEAYPRPDTASGDLRFYTLLSILARKYAVTFCALKADGTVIPPNAESHLLTDLGITLGDGSFSQSLQISEPDLIWFEFYHQVRSDYLDLIERHSPRARILVDSVDVQFNRLAAKAKLTNQPGDWVRANQIKESELAAYARADMIIAVSESDKKLLECELPGAAIAVIPNAHTVPNFSNNADRRFAELVFVGGFRHDPNVDAMVYFCHQVLPQVVSAFPDARLKIIGSHTPPNILNLANEHVEVVGYVRDIAPLLKRAYISVAPLRYGGGMKGKVGEAMSYGLPVVTTSFGAEGFGLVAGQDVLVGDTPEAFAAHTVSLLRDAALHDRIARSGYDFIARHYSVNAVATMLDATLDRLMRLPGRRRPMAQRLMSPLRKWFGQHVAWRLRS